LVSVSLKPLYSFLAKDNMLIELNVKEMMSFCHKPPVKLIS
jgi:hypothetical protein